MLYNPHVCCTSRLISVAYDEPFFSDFARQYLSHEGIVCEGSIMDSYRNALRTGLQLAENMLELLIFPQTRVYQSSGHFRVAHYGVDTVQVDDEDPLPASQFFHRLSTRYQQGKITLVKSGDSFSVDEMETHRSFIYECIAKESLA